MSGYSNEQLKAIFVKGTIIPGKDKDLYRKDAAGNEIYFPSYGKETEKGWEVDHEFPKAKGGSNRLSNLQPLQSSENAKKGAKYPYKA